MKKSLVVLSLALAFVPLAYSDDSDIKYSLIRFSIHSDDIQLSPVSGSKTILTESGVLYASNKSCHVIQSSLYDVGSDHTVNITTSCLVMA